MILIDTAILQQLMISSPEPAVVSLLSETALNAVFTHEFACAELGAWAMAELPADQREAAFTAVKALFAGRFRERVLLFDQLCVDAYVELTLLSRRHARGLSEMERLVGSIARTHRLTLVTRGAHRFEDMGIDLVDPFG